jgi:hypothetical protein
MLLLAVSVLPSATVRVEPVAGAVKVTLLTVVADATPSTGVTSVGEVANTTLPEPVVAASIVVVTVPVSPVVTKLPATAGTFKLNVDAVFGPTRLT